MVQGGAITDEDIAYYRARAESRPGMMITGAAVTHPSSARRLRTLVETYSEHALPGLEKRAAMIRGFGALAVGQLVHLGRETIGYETDIPPMAPSAIRSPRDPWPPHVMDEREIAEQIEGFALSAHNLLRTGHDGVELHAAHGYLIAQFLSPATNHRGDAWGGDEERRFRFLKEIVEAIRARCGADFLLGVRLSADEETGEGIEIADTLRIAARLQAMNAVDYLSITLGVRGAYVKDVSQPDAAAARAAGIVKANSAIPVLVGQRIARPELAEQVLAKGQADLIGMARALIADPHWLDKARDGRPAQIRPCIGVNQDCRAFAPHLHCAVNPKAGREQEAPFDALRPATAPRSIAIIGGGPAGLEAARAAALRGHNVHVFEESDGLGGQFLYASSVPHRQGLRRLLDFHQSEMRRLSIPVSFRCRIESPSDLPGHFDQIVLATGAAANPVPEEHAGDHVRSWFDILSEGAPAPHGEARAIMVDDGTGFWWNYGVAEMLGEAGWSVTYVTPSAMIGHQIPTESLAPMLARMGRSGTRFLPLTQLFDVEGREVQLIDTTSGELVETAADLTVLQTGRTSRDLRPAFGSAAHMIGDCITPRRMANAVFEGQRLGLVI
jgi:2,4-dienoyl-CoA reductase (NADPH2)